MRPLSRTESVGSDCPAMPNDGLRSDELLVNSLRRQTPTLGKVDGRLVDCLGERRRELIVDNLKLQVVRLRVAALLVLMI